MTHYKKDTHASWNDTGANSKPSFTSEESSLPSYVSLGPSDNPTQHVKHALYPEQGIKVGPSLLGSIKVTLKIQQKSER